MTIKYQSKVSVIVPAYNTQETLKKCLSSIKNSDIKIELIVINDNSTDDTKDISLKFADTLIINKKNLGSNISRLKGFKKSSDEYIVNIDSDIVVKKSTIKKAINFLEKNKDYSAVTANLDKNIPHKNFLTQYKNLYMNFILTKSAGDVNFLYGSFFAIRKKDLPKLDLKIKHTNDTELGQLLTQNGKKIKFLKSLQVIHLKKYNLKSLLKNDFKVPFEWAQIFILHGGWKQFGKNKSGFAHASKKQIVCLFLASTTLLLMYFNFNCALIVTGIWLILNLDFLVFLYKERGFLFFIKSIMFTFFDHIVMLCGVILGSFYSFLSMYKDKLS